ncbi:hypothetical protein [Actinoplanes sp. DH11]|uniref:hypothetical protein n=1 Tax=Actinoplanes sp. DH11 TaxID=2857011 RepID=UPI001E2DEC41|nr:hypothetical protein [Actinoplanes sp. DH11]
MGCARGHGLEQARQILPGYFVCDGPVMRYVPGPAGMHPEPTPCGERFHDGSAGPVAMCACGEPAVDACPMCRSWVGQHCLAVGIGRRCAICTGRERERLRESAAYAAGVHDRRLTELSGVTDPVERLLRAAAYLHGPPVHGAAADRVAELRRVCPFLDVRAGADLDGTGPFPWDSAEVGRWFVRWAGRHGVRPDQELLQGRWLRRRTPAWVIGVGATRTCLVPSGEVVRVTRERTVHRVVRGDPRMYRVALRVERAELPMAGLARLGLLVERR